MADPKVTYQLTRDLLIDPVDGDGPPTASLQSWYDVKGEDYAGYLYEVTGAAVDALTVWGHGWAVTVVDGTTYVWNGSGIQGQSYASASTPATAQRPNAIAALEATDLVFAGETDDGLFAFEVVPWILGDPIAEWTELDILATPDAQPMTVESHDTRLTLAADGVPHRLTSSWTTSIGETGTLTDEYRAVGLYVRILAPGRGAQTPDETSHFIRSEDDASEVESWIEILPDEGDSADVEIVIDEEEASIGFGMEGSIGFVRSQAASEGLILDTKLDLRGDSVQMPSDEQTIVVYIRHCGGNCGFLDDPTDLCAVEAVLEPGGRYELTVDVVGYDRANCAISPAG